MTERQTTVMQKLEVALVGTKWGLEQYLVESLEEDPWRFLVRVVKEGLAGLGLFRCCECGRWTHDLLPGANVCPDCAKWQRVSGREHLRELTEALEAGALHPDLYVLDHERLATISPQPKVVPHDMTTESPDFPEGEDLDTALEGIYLEADPATATVDWANPSIFSDWATDRLIAALETEVKKEHPPCES